MKLRRLAFYGVRGVADVDVDLVNPTTGAAHDRVVVTGPSASGKTRLLEAIFAAKEVVAPYGPLGPSAAWVEDEAWLSKVVLGLELDDEERAFANEDERVVEVEATFQRERAKRDASAGMVELFARYDHRGLAGKFEYFPATRRLPKAPPFHGTSEIEQRALRATKDARKYGFVPRFLKDLASDSVREARFSARLDALSPTCRYVRPSSEQATPRCFTSRGRGPASWTDLSDAESDAVIFAAVASAIGLDRSVVLVDRPELYVNPGSLRAYLEAMAGLGEGMQLVVATSSAAVVEATGQAAVVRLETP